MTVLIVFFVLRITFLRMSEEMDSLLRALSFLAAGVLLISLANDEPAAPRNGRARKSRGDRFAVRDEQRNLRWRLIFGGIFIVLGIVNLGVVALEAAG